MNNVGLIALILSVIFGSVGQILLKVGGKSITQMPFSLQGIPLFIKEIITNPFLLGWVVLGFSGSLLWIIAVAKLELGFAMPIAIASVLVLVMIMSRVFVGEGVSSIRWLGVIVIVVGIFLINK